MRKRVRRISILVLLDELNLRNTCKHAGFLRLGRPVIRRKEKAQLSNLQYKGAYIRMLANLLYNIFVGVNSISTKVVIKVVDLRDATIL